MVLAVPQRGDCCLDDAVVRREIVIAHRQHDDVRIARPVTLAGLCVNGPGVVGVTSAHGGDIGGVVGHRIGLSEGSGPAR